MLTAEADFCACVEAAKEVPFVAQILLLMGVEVEPPVSVRIDDIGATFVSKNVSSKHANNEAQGRSALMVD